MLVVTFLEEEQRQEEETGQETLSWPLWFLESLEAEVAPRDPPFPPQFCGDEVQLPGLPACLCFSSHRMGV